MPYNIVIPQKANLILNRLINHGFEAYVVGGYVRDSILGIKSSDIDITTNARPNQIKEVFKDFKTVDVGIDFGTVVIIIENQQFEVTTYRVDGQYKDGRKPENVEFSSNLIEDLKRRDFTINAMAYSPKDGLVDEFDGQNDLKCKTLRTVGNPLERISEDRLRMLRAIRFANRYDLKIEDELFVAIKENSQYIKDISGERINTEFSKIILSNTPVNGINLLYNSGLLEFIIEDLHKAYGFEQMTIHHNYDVYEHTMRVLKNTDVDLELRLAAIFHDLGKVYTRFIGDDGLGHFYGHEKVSEEICERELRKLRYDRKTITNVMLLVRRHMDAMNTYTEKSVRRLVRKMGIDTTRKLFQLQRADILATNNPDFVTNVDNGLNLLNDIIEQDKVVYVNQINISGRDILNLGYEEGRTIGLILDHVTEQVADGVIENDKECILRYISERSYKDEENNTCRFMFGA